MGSNSKSDIKPEILQLDTKVINKIEKLRYFIKYRFDGFLSRKFLYAFLDAFLFFLPAFGLLLNVFSKLILTTAFVGISLAILPFSPLYLVAGVLVAFTVMSLVMSIFKGIESYNKCKQSYDNENELIFDIVRFEVFKSLFKEHDVKLPGNLDRELVKPNYHKVPLSARIKSYSLTALVTLLGGMSLLSTFGAVTGLSVGSTTLLLGPVSPLLISAIFVIANVGLVLWFKNFFETDFISQSEKQRVELYDYQGKYGMLFHLAESHEELFSNITHAIGNFDNSKKYYELFKSKDLSELFSKSINQSQGVNNNPIVNNPCRHHRWEEKRDQEKNSQPARRSHYR